MSKFQIIVLAIFVLCIIAGVAGFALYRGGSSSTALPAITVWGTFPANTFNTYVGTINNGLASRITINYVQENPAAFHADFINALANGSGPDAILIPADMILPEMTKLTPIPFSALPERTFLDSYVQEADIYLSQNGILAVPFTLDPLMMYWNRDTFNAAGLATYPKFWDEFTALNQQLTVKDSNGNVSKTAVAMGDVTNITNARELLGTLILQLGNPVTSVNGTLAQSTLKTAGTSSAVPAVQFFTQFADPSNQNYSWNRAMPKDKISFLSGKLATYFGFASELSDLRAKNPNLNFDVAPIPQVRSGGVKATYGRMYGFSIVRASPRQDAAYQIISTLAAPAYLPALSQTMYLPPVLTGALAAGSNDPYITLFDQSALVAKTWLDAGPTVSSQIFGLLVQSIESGQKQTSQAVQDAGDQYDAALKQATQ